MRGVGFKCILLAAVLCCFTIGFSDQTPAKDNKRAVKKPGPGTAPASRLAFRGSPRVCYTPEKLTQAQLQNCIDLIEAAAKAKGTKTAKGPVEYYEYLASLGLIDENKKPIAAKPQRRTPLRGPPQRGLTPKPPGKWQLLIEGEDGVGLTPENYANYDF